MFEHFHDKSCREILQKATEEKCRLKKLKKHLQYFCFDRTLIWKKKNNFKEKFWECSEHLNMEWDLNDTILKYFICNNSITFRYEIYLEDILPEWSFICTRCRKCDMIQQCNYISK